MKIRITFECDDDLRRAVNRWYGQEGKATYDEMKYWFKANGESCNDDLLVEWDDDDG